MEAPLEPKKKPKNGGPAIKGATSYVECKLKSLWNAGKGIILCASVDAGEVLDADANTELLRADRVAMPAIEAETSASEVEVSEPKALVTEVEAPSAEVEAAATEVEASEPEVPVTEVKAPATADEAVVTEIEASELKVEASDLVIPATEVEAPATSVEADRLKSLLMSAALGRRVATAEAVASRSSFAGSSSAAPRAAATMQRRAIDLAGPGGKSVEQTWTGLTPGKEYKLQTLVRQVAEHTRTIRSLDRERDRFDIELAPTNGTTCNTYTIKGETATALIDASHKKFESLFMEQVESPDGGAIDLATLDYIIVSHTEPDPSGLIENLLVKAKEKDNEKFTVVGTKICITFLQILIRMDFATKVVRGGDQIDLGGGHVLDFVPAPNLHWPDTMFTYDHKTQLLYTCDAFGMHYCSETRRMSKQSRSWTHTTSCITTASCVPTPKA